MKKVGKIGLTIVKFGLVFLMIIGHFIFNIVGYLICAITAHQ